jgi:hypothetical protein
MMVAENILEEAFAILRRDGLEDLREPVLLQKLGLDPDQFREMFTDPDDLLLQAIRYDLEEDKKEKAHLLNQTSNPAEQIMVLLMNMIKKAEKFHPSFFMQLQQHPKAWNLFQAHLKEYSFFLVTDILNRGILEGGFRKDINIELVTKIIFEQMTMILNPHAFPPDRYNLAEVFRSFYFYYIRGLCTEQGAKMAEGFFAKNRF